MNIDETLSYIHAVCWRSSIPGLERIRALLALMGDPQKDMKFIHVTGTNGKGSTCAIMASILRAAGYRTGLFLLDLTDTGLTGKAVQDELDRHGITLNKNCVPNETRSPQQTSGVRIGTAAMTTKGYTEQDFIAVARQIDRIIRDMQDMRKE